MRIPDINPAQGQRATSEVVAQPNALQGMAEGLGSFAQLKQQSDERDAAAFYNRELSQLELDANTDLQQLQFSHDNINTFTDKASELFDKRAQQIRSRAPSNIRQDELDMKINNIRNPILSSAISYQAGERARVGKVSADTAADNIIKVALLTGDFDGAMAKLDGAASNYAASSTPASTMSYRNNTKKELAQLAIEQTLLNDPEQLNTLLTKYKDNIEAKDIVRYTESAASIRKQKIAEYEDELTKRQDKNRFSVFANLTDDPSSVTVSQIETMVSNNSLDPDDAEALIEYKTNPTARADDLWTVAEMENKLTLGDLTPQAVIQAASEGKLKTETAKKYIAATSSGVQENPSYRRATELLESNYEKSAFGVRSLIDEEALSKDKLELLQRVIGTNAIDPNFTGPEQAPENPLTVAQDIIERNKIAKQQSMDFSREEREVRKLYPNIRTKEDLAKFTKDRLTAILNKKVDKKTVERELNILNRIVGAPQ